MNGLITRTACDHGANPAEPACDLPRPSLRVGVIPGGSTDTVAYCIHGTTDIQTAVIHIIIGNTFHACSSSHTYRAVVSSVSYKQCV